MKTKLLTEDEKGWNRRARQRRKDQQKAARRRKLALATVHDSVLLADEQAVSGEKICELLWAKDFRPAKRAIRRLNALATATTPMAATSPAANPSLLPVPRPTTILNNAYRGTVPRLVVPPVPSPVDFLGLDRALVIAGEMARQGCAPAEVLHFLADLQAVGLGFKACAELADRAGIFPRSVSAAVVDALEAGRSFNSRLGDARALYRAMLANGEIEPVAGDWAFFPRAELFLLLPGLHLPQLLRHHEFLVNVIAGPDGVPTCLDLHSIRLKGLGRHPLR